MARVTLSVDAGYTTAGFSSGVGSSWRSSTFQLPIPLRSSVPVHETFTGTVFPIVPVVNAIRGALASGAVVSMTWLELIGVDQVPSAVCHWTYSVTAVGSGVPPMSADARSHEMRDCDGRSLP